MPFPWLPSAIAGAASLLGGESANRQAARAAREQAALQREFAQKGIQWRVADAKAAGIHPLYALGAQTNSYQPVSRAFQNSLGDAGQSAAIRLAESRAQKDAQSVLQQELDIKRSVAQSEVTLNNAQAQAAIAEAASIRRSVSGEQAPAKDYQDAVQELSRTDDPTTAAIETVLERPVEFGFGKMKFQTSPGMTPGSVWQELFGEPGEWIGGTLNLLLQAGYGLDVAFNKLVTERYKGRTPSEIRRDVEAKLLERPSRGSYFRYKDQEY